MVGLIAAMSTRLLPCDDEGKLAAQTFRNAIENDLGQDLIPFYLVATMGATTTCSWDNLEDLGNICQEHDIWMHVDAAYAGAALVCPELRHMAKGLHFASSFTVGLHKLVLMSLDVVGYWMKDTQDLGDVLTVDRLDLKHKHSEKAADFVNLQIGTRRKFKALKIWMVLKNFGVKGVQNYIRRHVMLAKYMEQLMRSDDRFTVDTSRLGLVVFALKSGNCQTEKLRTLINDGKRIMLSPCLFNGNYFIRFVVNFSTRMEHVDFAWDEIRKTVDEF